MISIKGLSFGYGNTVIYDDVSVEIPSMGVNFLMGKNGSGKTTLIKCILDFMDYSGEITINNQKYKNNKKEVFAVFDDSSLYKNLTGLQNIILITGVKKDFVYKKAEKFLSKEILNKKVKKYSYGERKKVFLIIIEILRPNLLIMDEVSNGLDYETMVLLKSTIKEWARSSMIVLTGHQFEFYKDIVERIFVINRTKIKCINKKEDLTLEEIYEKTIE